MGDRSSSVLEYRQSLEGKAVDLPEQTIRYIICKTMHWDWWTYYEQPPEFLNDILEHLTVEAIVTKNNAKTPPGKGNTVSQDSDDIFNYREKVE